VNWPLIGIIPADKSDVNMNTESQPMTELMTIGYEGLSLAEFFGILERCRVTTLVDVRELPISRRPGFAKTALSAALVRRGIKYVHMPALGCPRDIRHRYRDDEDWSRYTKHFQNYLATQPEALVELSQVASSERCCLMCFEEDYNFCHRKFVAERVAPLIGASIRIFHLTGPIEGRVVRHELAAA
jgi:uncharacterized protein (DUF488 family)